MVGQIVESWSGREPDLSFLSGDLPVIGPSIPMAMAFGQALKEVAGPQKVVQSFVSLLLTRQGTSTNPDVGCGFMSAVLQGLIRTESDLRNQFSLAVSALTTQLNTGVWRADERLASAVLEGASVDRQRITMRIRITTDAGESVTFLAPVERQT